MPSSIPILAELGPTQLKLVFLINNLLHSRKVHKSCGKDACHSGTWNCISCEMKKDICKGPKGSLIQIKCNSDCKYTEYYDCSYYVESNYFLFKKTDGRYSLLWRKGSSDNDNPKQISESSSFDDDLDWHFHCVTLRASDGKVR